MRIALAFRCIALVVIVAHAPPAQGDHLISLDSAYQLALKNNPTLQMLEERVVQAEATRQKAWSSLKPTATLQGTFTHFDQEISVQFPNPGTLEMDSLVFQKQNQFGFNAVANLPLFRGPAYPAIGMSRKGVELAKLGQLRSRQDFLLRVAQVYYLAVSSASAVEAITHKLQVDLKHLAAARAQFEVGQAPRSTVMRADLVATQDQQYLQSQKNMLQAIRRQLAILIGVEGVVREQRPHEPLTPRGSGQHLIQMAMKGRPDLKATEVALNIAKQSKDAVWWQFAPMLDLNWLYRWTEAAGFGEKGSWNLMFTLTLPLYDGGKRYADLRESHSKIREAMVQRKLLGQQIESDIVRLQAEMISAEAGVISAQKVTELAKTTVEDMEASFEAGAATQLDLLDASQRLLEAEIELTKSLHGRDLARLSLFHAMGQFDPGRKN